MRFSTKSLLVLVVVGADEVELHARLEHEEQEPGATEQLDRSGPFDQAEPVRSDRDVAGDEVDDRRDPRRGRGQRGEEHDREQDEEDERGVLEGHRHGQDPARRS